MDEVIAFINKYASVPVLITAVYNAFVFKRLVNELKIFSFFIFLSGLTELVSKVLWFQKINNFPLLHFYVAAGFLIICWFYSSVLQEFVSKKIIWGGAALFTVLTVVNSIFYQSIYSFNSNALVVQSILIIILSLSTFILFLNDIVRDKRPSLIKSLNWINSGLFIYYLSSLLIFYFSNFFTENFPVLLNQYTWALHMLFSTTMYACFFIGLWKNPQKAP